MPELPEVETVKETLKKQILHKTILKVDVFYEGIISTNLDDFKKNIINEQIIGFDRLGKYLIIELTNYALIVHLRMEGKFYLKSNKEPFLKHEHIIFYLDDITLRYHDTRKFGKMYLLKKDDLYKKEPLNKLGLEPWNKNLTSSYLKEKFNRNIPIKTLLLNQDIICGIGNIYADEILFLSHIHPLKKGNTLTNKDCDNIIINTRSVLEEAILCGGTTIRSYTSSLGVTGRFQNKLYVHNKENEKCPICGNIIIKIKVGGRGTYFCPHCEKE